MELVALPLVLPVAREEPLEPQPEVPVELEQPEPPAARGLLVPPPPVVQEELEPRVPLAVDAVEPLQPPLVLLEAAQAVEPLPLPPDRKVCRSTNDAHRLKKQKGLGNISR